MEDEACAESFFISLFFSILFFSSTGPFLFYTQARILDRFCALTLQLSRICVRSCKNLCLIIWLWRREWRIVINVIEQYRLKDVLLSVEEEEPALFDECGEGLDLLAQAVGQEAE